MGQACAGDAADGPEGTIAADGSGRCEYVAIYRHAVGVMPGVAVGHLYDHVFDGGGGAGESVYGVGAEPQSGGGAGGDGAVQGGRQLGVLLGLSGAVLWAYAGLAGGGAFGRSGAFVAVPGLDGESDCGFGAAGVGGAGAFCDVSGGAAGGADRGGQRGQAGQLVRL